MAKRLKKKFKVSLFLLIIIITTFIVSFLSMKLLDNPNDHVIKQTSSKTNKTTEPPPKAETAKLTFVGDLLFEQPYYDALDSGEDQNRYFSLVKPYFQNDDLSIANMEVVIGTKDMEPSGSGYNFCAPPEIGNLVTTVGFEVLSTANNHSYDRGVEGINSTINFFKNNSNILTVGTNTPGDESLKIKEVNGIKFGFISYTLGTNIVVPTKERNLVNLYRDPSTKEISTEYKTKIKNDVERYKGKVDVMIALIHWGQEFTYTPNKEQKTLANYLNSLGIDIIIGSHSHCLQPIEWIGDEHKTLVYYSMGNFVSADKNITRTGEIFNNAYQVGLLSSLEVNKKDGKITIDNIKTEPIIDYYDTNLKNFLLIPFSQYTEEYEKSHYRYKNNFNRNFISNMYETVINAEFRK